MSRAFIKEDSQVEAPLLAHRPPLPAGLPNYVTARGLAQLRQELLDLTREDGAREDSALEDKARIQALGARRAELEERLHSAVLVEPPVEKPEIVRFGAHVRVRDASAREKSYQIVGADEAEPAQGRIAFFTPLARALIGLGVGDDTQVQTPRGEEHLEVLSISYPTA